ncbi:MAG: hypothetical protein PHW75_01550 [Patescibacteria group bacterium]|nr:hypothetical protein [Patescibacteria group bacterium]
MFYEKIWKKLGFNSKYYRSLVESSALAFITALLFLLVTYLELPVHFFIADIYSKLGIIPSIPFAKASYLTVHWILIGIAIWYPIKLIVSNVALVIVPHLKNLFNDDLFYEEMDYDIDDEVDL